MGEFLYSALVAPVINPTRWYHVAYIWLLFAIPVAVALFTGGK